MGIRDLPRIGQRGACSWVVLTLVVARPASGTPVELKVECAALTREQRQELDARVRLLLHGAPAPSLQTVEIDCSDASGVVTLRFIDHVRSMPLPAEGQPVERVLLAIEQLLAEEDSTTGAPPPASTPHPEVRERPPAPSPSPQPAVVPLAEMEAARAPTPAPRQAETIGGAGLGVSVERWPDPANVAVGPRLDLAWGKGSWAATSFESLRFGSSPDDSLLSFDALLGVAWGAPFAAQRAGAVLAVGGEWFSAGSSARPTGQRTSSSFVVDLGLRWAEPLGAAALWLGADGRFRVRPPELPEPISASLSRWSVIVSLGGALTVR